jgi:hypothetical protein
VSDALGDDLEEKFGLIEQFLAIFENDEVVERASVKLIASILKAVEDVIGYYTKNMCEFGASFNAHCILSWSLTGSMFEQC